MHSKPASTRHSVQANKSTRQASQQSQDRSKQETEIWRQGVCTADTPCVSASATRARYPGTEPQRSVLLARLPASGDLRLYNDRVTQSSDRLTLPTAALPRTNPPRHTNAGQNAAAHPPYLAPTWVTTRRYPGQPKTKTDKPCTNRAETA